MTTCMVLSVASVAQCGQCSVSPGGHVSPESRDITPRVTPVMQYDRFQFLLSSVCQENTPVSMQSVECVGPILCDTL